MTEHYGSPTDVTVLGAGIVGICCALSLLESGRSVTVIDKNEPGSATSYGNAGVISPWSCVPQCTPGVWKNVPKWLLDPKGPVKVRWRDLATIMPWTISFMRNTATRKVSEIADAMDFLMRDNIDSYRRFLDGTGHEGLIVDSWLVNVFRGKVVLNQDDPAWRLREERGAPLEFVGGSELRDIEPDISDEYQSALLVKDQARTVSPGRLCEVLADKARAMGAIFRRMEVSALRAAENGSIVLLSNEDEIQTKKLVLCGGIWSARLLEPFGLKIPLIAERGYHLEFCEPGVRLNNSVLDGDAKVIISSMKGGLRVAGTAEFADIDAPPNYARARVLAPVTKRVLPRLNTEITKEWMGIRPSFPDNLPAIGPVKGLPNLIAAFGHSHYGLGMAPATGRMVSEFVMDAEPNADRSAFQLERFDKI